MRVRTVVAAMVLVAALATVTLAGANGVFEGYPIVKLVINGAPLQAEVPAINFKGRTLAPVRALVEAVGGTVAWDGSSWTTNVVLSGSSQLRADLEAARTVIALRERQVTDLTTRLDAATARIVDLEKELAIYRAVPSASSGIGETAQVGEFAVTVHGFRAYAGDQSAKPRAGNSYLAVDLTVENVGSQPRTVSGVLMCRVADSNSYAYPMCLAAPGLRGSIDGELAPGRKVRGEVAFEVPLTSRGFEFMFTPSPLRPGQAIIPLTGKGP
jgi:hypothetical protein